MSGAAPMCRRDAAALDPATVLARLAEVPGWGVEGHHLARVFDFPDFHATMRFVDALAPLIHAQDHHPVLTVSYGHCKVSYTTHSAGNAITDNDFLCAAQANAVFDRQARA